MGDRAAAIKMYNMGVPALNDKSNANAANHAFQLFLSACIADPTYGTAQYQHGQNCGDVNCLHAAIGHYRRALRCEQEKEERVRTLSNISWRLHQIGYMDEALKYANEAIELDATNSYAWVNLSIAEGMFGNKVAAEAAVRKALEIAPNDTTVQFAAAFALLFNRKLQEGFGYYEARFPARLPQYNTYPYPRWQGETDKTVYLVSDQGMGDTLSFSRFIDKASERAKFIHAGIQPELMRAFNEAFCHIQNINFVPIGTGFPPADCWTTIMSLPFALKLTDKEIRDAPHPKFPVYGIDHSWKVPDQKMHIGIAWTGNPQNDIHKWRAIPLERFLDLYRVPGIQLYGLQCDSAKDDIQKIGAHALIRDVSPWIRDVVDAISVIEHLDLIISAETFLPHLAGAMNKEVWIPYANHAHDFRIGHDGSDILWYKNHRLFHQDKDLSWERVFDQIEHALRERLGIDDYDAKDDFAKSIDVSYAAIRERKANGGRDWKFK